MSKSDLIESIMTADVETVKEDESMENAIKRMVSRNIGCIVVVEGNGSVPVGIVTERDIARCVAKGIDTFKGPVKNVMSSPLITTEITEPVQDAITLMLTRCIRRLPVLQNRRLVGIISERDLLRWVLKITYEPHVPSELKQIVERPVHSKN